MLAIFSKIKYVLLGLSVILVGMYYTGSLDTEKAVTWMLNWGISLLVIAAVSAVVFPFIYIIGDPKSAVSSLIGVVVLAILLGVAYSMSDTTPVKVPETIAVDAFFGNDDSEKSMLILTDMGLISMYTTFFGALVITLLAEVISAFK